MDEDIWRELPPDVVAEFLRMNQPEARPPPVPLVSLSRIPVPHIQREEDDIPDLKRHLTHLWIFLHNKEDRIVRKSKDYQEFSKMYQKSKYLLSRFSVHVDRLPTVLQEINNSLELSVKCYVHAEVIIDDLLWNKVWPHFARDQIGEIVVKSGTQIASKRELERKACQRRFDREFKNPMKYSGYVSNFDDALQLQKKIMNLALSNSKPNFFILNQYETVEATENLNTFHDVLINTKAYLKESLDIKSKEMVVSSLKQFKQFVYEQLYEYYQLLAKKRTYSQAELESRKERQIGILNPFFKLAENTIDECYPFTQSDQQEQLYAKIIILYSQETIIYKVVNNLCKTITSKEIFMKIGFFCKFLNLAIKYYGKKILKGISRKKQEILYRGALMNEIEQESLARLVGKNGYIINMAFFSASHSQAVAKKFLKYGRNNILIKIMISKLFWKLCQQEPYSNYLQYFVDLNLQGLAQSVQEQEVLFNCYNVFKVIKFYQQDKIKVLELEAFSHLQIIERKISGEKISEDEQKILDVIVRVEKERDYAEQLKEQGKTEEMVAYLEKVVDNGVDLNVNQAESYIKFMVENNKNDTVEKFIEKVEEKAEISIKQEMKLAVYQSIKEEYLQTELLLQSISSKMEIQQSQKSQQKQKEHVQVRQSWTDLMNKMNLRFAVAVNKEKIGAYEEFFTIVEEILFTLHPETQISEFIQNLQTWNRYYQYLNKIDTLQRYSEAIIKHRKHFQHLYNKIKQKKKKIDNKQILQFLTDEMLSHFLISIFQNQQKKQFVIDSNELRRDIQAYKAKFYERSKLKVKILSYYYQILIKSQRMHQLKADQEKQKNQSTVIKNLFEKYFENNQGYLSSINDIYQRQPSIKYKYQAAIFFKEYAKFLNGYTFFHKMDTQSKNKKRNVVKQLFKKARDIVAEINKEHEEVTNIQNIQDTIMEERLFQEKINKSNFIYKSLNPGSDNPSQSLDQKELVTLVETLKNSRMECAKSYNSKNSLLNENLCYTSVLNTTIQIVERALSNSDLKQKYSYDFQKLANKINSNVDQNVYLKQHTSNAFNNYLRASFQFFKGHYETSMVHIGKSQQILDMKLKTTEQRIASQTNLAKKIELQEKLKTIRQNNEVRIKICLLKARICINYKPSIHTLCINNLSDQQKFIKQKLFQSNSALSEIYYYETYLSFISQSSNHHQKKLELALRILLPNGTRQTKNSILRKELLRYYILQFYISPKNEKDYAAQRIEELARQHRITISRPISIRMADIEEYEAYCIFKVEVQAIKKNFFLALLMEGCLKNIRKPNYKPELEKLYASQEKIKALFTKDLLLYWQAIDTIINMKFDNSLLVSYQLFLFYFLYLQYLIATCTNRDVGMAFRKLQKLIRKLEVIVYDSERSKTKYMLTTSPNCGFEDKIKIILLKAYTFGVENWCSASGILLEEIYQGDLRKFKEKYFVTK